MNSAWIFSTRHRLWIVGLLVAACLASSCSRPAREQAGDSPQDWQHVGPVQVIDGHSWVVGGQLVDVPPEATVAGKPRVGAMVRLTGKKTVSGELRADAVQVIEDAGAANAQPASASTGSPTSEPPARAPTRREDDEGGDD